VSEVKGEKSEASRYPNGRASGGSMDWPRMLRRWTERIRATPA